MKLPMRRVPHPDMPQSTTVRQTAAQNATEPLGHPTGPGLAATDASTLAKRLGPSVLEPTAPLSFVPGRPSECPCLPGSSGLTTPLPPVDPAARMTGGPPTARWAPRCSRWAHPRPWGRPSPVEWHRCPRSAPALRPACPRGFPLPVAGIPANAHPTGPAGLVIMPVPNQFGQIVMETFVVQRVRLPAVPLSQATTAAPPLTSGVFSVAQAPTPDG